MKKDVSEKRIALSWQTLGMLLVTVWFGGCYEPVPPPRVVGEEHDIQTFFPLGQYHIGGRSVGGRSILYQVFGEGKEVVFILAGIHGSETAGPELVRYLGDYLDRNRRMAEGRTIVLLPVVNPDGKAAGTRTNARGVDLNRNFPASNRVASEDSGPRWLSEPESVVLWRLVNQYKPARIVSVHQPLECIDYDGPSQGLAACMARSCPLPVRKLGARPGSLGAYTGEKLGIPIVTMELREADTGSSGSQLWYRYGKALLAAIEY